MTVKIEKDGPVWTIIHDRPEARNAMDPKSADALTAAFLEFFVLKALGDLPTLREFTELTDESKRTYATFTTIAN